MLEFPITKRFRPGIYEVRALAIWASDEDKEIGKFGAEQPPYLFFKVSK